MGFDLKLLHFSFFCFVLFLFLFFFFFSLFRENFLSLFLRKLPTIRSERFAGYNSTPTSRAMVFSIFFSLRYAFLFSFCPFFYFHVDTSHGSFLIFSPFSFAFVFGFIGGLVYLSMVSSSKVRIACPLISFLFAR